MQPTEKLLTALQFATFEDEDMENMVKEVITQLDSDLNEADYDPSSAAATLYAKFNDFMKDYLAEKLAEDEDSEDEDEDDDEEYEEDDEDDDEEDDEDDYNEDEEEDSST